MRCGTPQSVREAEFIRDLDVPTDNGGVSTNKSQKLWKIGEEHVVTSAAVVMGKAETYVFHATADGEITDWGQLPGSYHGGLDHERAIAGHVEEREEV